MNFDFYIQTSKSLVQLFQPLIEIVVHDLATKKIIFIDGFLSKRKKNDPSLIDEDIANKAHNIDQIVYTKLNFDGRLIKSVSIPIKEKNKIVGLWCFNYDVTHFKDFQQIAHIALQENVKRKPTVLFENDWQDKINQFIYNYLKEHNLQFNSLANKEKKEIIYSLYKKNAFREKNAADYIAKTMNISRSTVFNYLREWK
ncbi:MAG: hypothetical protein CL947_02135 [Epsilonproteobacteria bacterium]|nr:hypothetical protein [Campylobacterota bacterium]|tara:strand:+ start:12467 stop:13063 length:597 start_codon:yes stop_codon:yes gene_type:complete